MTAAVATWLTGRHTCQLHDSPPPRAGPELDEIKHQLEEAMGARELERHLSRVRHDSECRSQENGYLPPTVVSR